MAEGTVLGGILEGVWSRRRLTRGRESTWESEEPHPQAVVLPCLIGESEESEENKCTKNGTPPSGLSQVDDSRVDQDPWVLADNRVPPVGVSPGDPWVNIQHRTVNDYSPKGHRDGETEVGGSQDDETPVAAVSNVRVGSDEIPELLSPPHEGADGEDWE